MYLTNVVWVAVRPLLLKCSTHLPILKKRILLSSLPIELLSKHIKTDLLKLFKGLFLLNNFLSFSNCKANFNIDISLTLACNSASLVKRYLPKRKSSN